MLLLSLTQPIHLQRAANSTEITLKFLYSKKSLAIEARPVGGDRKSRMDVTWSDLSAMRLLLTVSPTNCLFLVDPMHCLVARDECLKGSSSSSFSCLCTAPLAYFFFFSSFAPLLF